MFLAQKSLTSMPVSKAVVLPGNAGPAAVITSASRLIVEILKDGRPARPGESGEAVITNLHSLAMPLSAIGPGTRSRFPRKKPRAAGDSRSWPGFKAGSTTASCSEPEKGSPLSPFSSPSKTFPGPGVAITQESFDCLHVEIDDVPEFNESLKRTIVKILTDWVVVKKCRSPFNSLFRSRLMQI